MNLHHLLQGRAAACRPVRIALIGAGKFGAMFLAQARLTPGFHVAIVADLNVAKAREALAATGWPADQVAAADLGAALKTGAIWVTDDSAANLAAAENEGVIDATEIGRASCRARVVQCVYIQGGVGTCKTN